MKFIPLVWAGIQRKPSRSILIFLQVIIAFALFGMLQGLASGINYAIASAHADRLYVESKLDPGYPLPDVFFRSIQARLWRGSQLHPPPTKRAAPGQTVRLRIMENS